MRKQLFSCLELILEENIHRSYLFDDFKGDGFNTSELIRIETQQKLICYGLGFCLIIYNLLEK